MLLSPSACVMGFLIDMVHGRSGVQPAYKLSVNDFIIKASALALRDHPDVNSSWMAGECTCC